MIAEDQHDDSGSEQDAGDQVVTLLRYLFHDKFCPANEIPESRKGGVLPICCYSWLQKNTNLMNADKVVHAADVPSLAWNNMCEILNNGGPVEHLHQSWYTICIRSRTNPQQNLQSFNMIVGATWEDKTVSASQQLVSLDMIHNDEGFTDALAAAILGVNFRSLVNLVAEHGLDGLHKTAQKFRFTSPEPEDPYDVAMGMILKRIPQLKPALQEPVRNFMRLAQQCIRLPVAVVGRRYGGRD